MHLSLENTGLIALGSWLLLLGPQVAQWATADAVTDKPKWQYQYPPIPAGVTPPTDPQLTPQEHVQDITTSEATYTIPMSGTMDGVNTRSPMGYAAWTQTFQPMRFVRLENTGDTDLVNPRLVVNDKRQWWTTQDIVATALRTYGNPTSDADKARAIWEYQISHRFHGSPNSHEGDDPVKMYNIFGYTLCNNEGTITMDLYRTAGLKVRYGYPVGHVVTEVFYDNRWHLMDSDQNMLFLLPDNQTLAGDEDVARDHDLVKRIHSYSINHADARELDEFCASAYYHEGRRVGEYRSKIKHTMAMTLRPGEAIEWRFARREGAKFYGHGHDPRQTQGATAGRLSYNGLWTYTPDLRDAAKRRVVSATDVVWSDDPAMSAMGPASVQKPAAVVWKVASPYVLVGGSVTGQVRLGEGDQCNLSISLDDGATWKRVENWAGVEGEPGAMRAILDEWFPSRSNEAGVSTASIARYSYLLRLELIAKSDAASVGVDALSIENVIQHAPLSLPELELGDNTITYRDETTGSRQARLTFNWVKCSASQAPLAPVAAVSPADAASVQGTKFVFEWTAAEDPDGDSIADYHIQLSDREEMRWPLSPNFNKLSTNTADQSPTMYTTPYEGLLNPGQTYYWRVRALDSKGVWGPWSKTWSFVAHGPGVPLDVALAPREDGTVELTWRANDKGNPPDHFELYASNEKGFTVSREPYAVYTGLAQEGTLFPQGGMQTIESNLLQTVSGERVSLRPSHAFYRVVAVDAAGHRSGPSDFVAAPRPFIFSEPLAQATVGKPYEYQVKCIASIGDLRTLKNSRTGFWTAEKPAYTLLQGPAWLTIDVSSGRLSGAPDAAGTFDVRIEAAIEGIEAKAAQSYPLTVNAGE